MATTATTISGADLHTPPRSPVLPSHPVSLETRNALVLDHLPEVRSIAAGIARRLPREVQLDDLIQAGSIGLIDAISRFDRTRPYGLRQYLRIRITGAILDSLRENDWASRYMRSRQQKLAAITGELERRLGRSPESQEIAEEMGLDLQSFYEFAVTVEDLHRVEEDDDSDHAEPVVENLPQDPALSPDALCAAFEKRQRLHHAMGFLKAEQRRVLRLYYFEEQTMAEIATTMHLTESRISQIHSRALEELFYTLRHGRPRRAV